MLRIGIDVGGTHTDAVLLDGDEVVASTKSLTSRDVSSGILEALETILMGDSGVEEKVAAVMLGTTQFTNAVIERRELAEVAAIRIGLPSGRGIPPKTGWPEDIARCLGGNVYMLRGGYLYDGWPLAQLDDREIDQVIGDLKAKRVEAVAISSACSPSAFAPRCRISISLNPTASAGSVFSNAKTPPCSMRACSALPAAWSTLSSRRSASAA